MTNVFQKRSVFFLNEFRFVRAAPCEGSVKKAALKSTLRLGQELTLRNKGIRSVRSQLMIERKEREGGREGDKELCDRLSAFFTASNKKHFVVLFLHLKC